MKLILPLLFIFFTSIVFTNAQNNFGNFASAIKIQTSGGNSFHNTTGSGANLIGTTTFGSSSLGTYVPNSGTLKITGAEIKTWKNGSGNVCGGTLYYQVYITGSASGSFSSLSIPFKANCSSGTFADGLGPCNGSDQKWSTESASIDLTARCAGNYTLEIYYDETGSDTGGGCGTTIAIKNGTANFSANFTISAIAAPSISINNATICAGASATLTATDCAGTVNWSNGSSGSSINVSTAGTYTATCTVSGCTSGNSNAVSLTVNPTPTVSPGAVCNNTSKQVELSTTTVSGATYSWTGPDGFSSASQNPTLPYSVSATPTKAGIYNLTVTNNGCSDSDEINVDCSALPVTLVGFTAQASSDEEGIVLTWETSSEINNSHFEIERSADAKDFQKIAVVECKGTTNELTTYSFIDKSPLNGVNYYRLRQVDLDGKFEFSKIRSVRNETVATNAITFGPNPTEEIISFRGIKKGSKIAVIDMYGKEKFVTTQEDDSLKLQINVEKYSRGLYLVKIYTEGYVEFRKFYVN